MNLLRIKIENILVIIYLPIGLVNITKAEPSTILFAIILQGLLITGLHYGIRSTRKELIKDILEGEYEDLLEDIAETIESLIRVKEAIINTFRSTKKEVIGSKLKTTKLKDAFLKYNF